MRLVLVHAHVMTRELVRYPAYLVPTLLFPTIFFLFFAVPNAGRDATVKMAGFAGFAAIGVAFFQFGVGIAAERGSPWEVYLRTLPVGVATRLAARLLSAALFAVAAAALVIVTAQLLTDVSLAASRWLLLGTALLAGVVPFALLGIALGYLVPQRAALPIANLLYLVLSYAGGLWVRPAALPEFVRSLSPCLPTRALADLLGNVVYGNASAATPWVSLAGFSTLFAALAALAYVRDEGERYR